MPINSKTESDYSQWQELVNLKAAESGELENIKCHLDLVLLALKAIANISSEEIIQAAQDLQLESAIADRLTLWQLASSNPKDDSRDRKKLEVEEVRSLGLIICHLANQHQELLRRGVNLLEQVTEQNESPHQTTLLGDYLDKFINSYQARIANSQNIPLESLSHLAWKLLTALLFYSGQNGHRLLWVAIFNAVGMNSD
jgi:signal recognition particle subunit SEC65